MIPKTLWQAELSAQNAPNGQDLGEAALAARCDVVVIGAGLTGLSTALHLARGGRDVVVLERDRVGAGASTRNGGMTLAGLKRSPAELLRSFGPDLGRRLYRASLDAIDFTEAFLEREAIDCEFRRYGVLWAAYTAGHYRELSRVQALLAQRFAHETALLAKAELRNELDSPLYQGGLLDPLSAGLHPGRLVAGLLTAARRQGVAVHEACEVTGVDTRGPECCVTTGRGTVRCRQVVVATNGYTPDFLSGLRRRVIPIGSYIVVTAPLHERAATLIPRGRMVFDTKHLLYYFRMVGDRLLFGGRTSFRRISDAEAARRLHAGMLEVFPQLDGVGIDYSWSGNVAFTFDQLPHLGSLDGLYYALGYCGHGVAMGLYAGHHLAELLLHGATALPFAELPLQSRGYYRREPWFLPWAGLYYQLADRFARALG